MIRRSIVRRTIKILLNYDTFYLKYFFYVQNAADLLKFLKTTYIKLRVRETLVRIFQLTLLHASIQAGSSDCWVAEKFHRNVSREPTNTIIGKP